MSIKKRIYELLKWSEKFTGTDMIYIVKGGFWLILGRILSFLASLAIMMAFARFAPKKVYGAYQYVLSLAIILNIFSLPGMNTALIRAVARGCERTILSCAKERIKWGAIGSLIAFFISSWYFLNQNSNLGFSFLIVAIFLPFINALSLYLFYWEGKKKFDIQNKYFIFHNFLGALILISIIFLTNNLALIILTYFFAFTLAEGIFFRLTIKKVSNQKEDKETIPFGKHLTLMQTASVFSTQIDKIVLWQLLGPAPVAIYSFAQRPVLRTRELIPIISLALPKLSQRNIKEIKKSLFKKFSKLFLFILPLTFFYILVCPYFFKIFFPAYLDSIRYSQILSLILIFSPFFLLRSTLVAEMKKKELYTLNFATPILKTILFLILIPIFGIWGAVISILASQVFSSILTLYFFKKI